MIVPMELYLASGNRHKQQEFAEMLPEFRVLLPADRNIAFAPEENGSSFFGNARPNAFSHKAYGFKFVLSSLILSPNKIFKPALATVEETDAASKDGFNAVNGPAILTA